MNRKPATAIIELEDPNVVTAQSTTSGPIAAAVDLLAQGGVAVLRIRPETTLKQVAIVRAESLLQVITRCLIQRNGLPPEAYVELDAESYGTPVAPFREKRFLLPHHDGGHCSFLTPSRLDYPAFDASERVFSRSVYWKRPSHKLYQGFLITNPGTTCGSTYYYNTLTLLWDAFIHRYGRSPAGFPELAHFNVENLRRSRNNQTIHGSRYLTLGALLGSTRFEHHVMPSGPRAESELWPVQYARLPLLCEMTEECPCSLCAGPGGRLLCHACKQTLGRTWPEVHADYSTRVVGELHDILIGNNLTQLHAADSNTSRTILPMCIVTDKADGSAYEQWLATQWRHWYGASENQERASVPA